MSGAIDAPLVDRMPSALRAPVMAALVDAVVAQRGIGGFSCDGYCGPSIARDFVAFERSVAFVVIINCSL
jgi:hypothetical protein